MAIIRNIFILLLIFFCSFQTLSAEGLSYGKKIFAMYKSSDQYSAAENPIKWYFERYIKNYGFEVKYHDFDNGIPDLDDLDDVRAILTWYNSGLVKNKDIAVKYAKFLKGAADAGIKIIIVNSYGAYGYKDGNTEKWDLLPEYEPLFNKLGFSFKGFWTKDPSKLKIVYKDSKIVEDGGRKQDVNVAKHYQQIVPIRDDVVSHLKIMRTDDVQGIGDGVSSVILTSNSGGFAMEQYAFQGGKFLLNPVLFVKKSLFLDDGFQKVAVVIGDVAGRDKIKGNIKYAFFYSKVNYDNIDVKKLKKMVGEDLSAYEAVIFVIDNMKDIPRSLLEDYVKNGGNAIFMRYANVPSEYFNIIGLKEYAANVETLTDGYIFNDDFFMNKDRDLGEKVDLNIKKAKLAGSRVIAKVRNRIGYPLVWERSLGKGKVLYWNTDKAFQNKSYRGSIVQSIHYCQKGFVSGLANVAVMMIDDYPAPLWNTNYREYRLNYYNKMLVEETDEGKKALYKSYIEKIKKYKSQTDANFVLTQWFRDIKNWEKTLGFKYSTFMIFNYNSKTKSSDDLKDGFRVKDLYIAKGVKDLGKVIMENGWDLGFHGYNHMSLSIEKPEEYASTPWPNKEDMIKALTVSRNEWIKLYGDFSLPFSYVAPHNIIDDTGLEALGEAFPSIKVVCTLYSGYKDERSQEFEWYPGKRFFQIPRLASGFVMSKVGRAALNGSIHNFGVISYFIHPDDVFDESRSFGFKGWDWMKSRFENDFKKINKDYPWLRWMTVRDAFFEFIYYNNIRTRIKEENKKIIVEFNDGSEKYFYFRLRLSKGSKIKKLINCKKVFENKSTGDFVFKTTDNKSIILLR